MPLFRGRIVDQDKNSVILISESGQSRLEIKNIKDISIGDIVEVKDGLAKLLTPNRSTEKRMNWSRHVLDPRRKKNMKIRDLVQNGIREFFRNQGFHETRTPLLVPCPGMEPHIRPFQVKSTDTTSNHTHYLPTSPEFAMKRLLVGGLEKIFQICPAFRDEPNSTTHQPEFTMLEWYRAYANYEEIMKDTEELFCALAMRISGKPVISFQGKEISVKTPWPRLRTRDLFLEKVGIDLTQASTAPLLAEKCNQLGIPSQTDDTWDDLYFRIWLNCIEPSLPADQAVFVTRYPASQAALAVVDQDPDGSFWARRFEAYAGGLELGNAFEELTDPIEQRRRFVEDMDFRERTYGPSFPKSPLDEGFLEALTEGMPPSAGIAVGVDRMVMLLANEADIHYTFWI